MKKFSLILCFAIILTKCLPVNAQQNDNIILLNNLILDLRESESTLRTNRIIKKIIKLNISFESIKAEIRSDNYYSQDKKTGYIEWNYILDSLNYTCIVLVPSNYSSIEKHPASFILHGGVMSYNPIAVKSNVTKDTYNYDSLDRIIIYPTGWYQSPWWSEKQVNNLKYLVRRLKLEYNIDENNISLAGISDGGTGVVYQANKAITPWANFRSYISNPGGLTTLTDSPIYFKNLKNKAFLFISSEEDELFPPQFIESFLAEMEDVDCTYDYYLAKGFKHEISWLNCYKDTISHFMKNNIRNQYPSTIFWQTDNLKYGRNLWVIIDKLNNNSTSNFKKHQSHLPKNGSIPESGAIEIQCTGNKIYVETENIKQYTLLLSPEQFNFNESIEVYTNNTLSFDETVIKDPHTLLKWYYEDLDRTMLFGNELIIKVN